MTMPLHLECPYRLATIDSRLIGHYKAPCNHVVWGLWYVYVYFLLVRIHAAAVHYDRALTTWKEVRTVDCEVGSALLYLYCISSRVNTTRNKTHDTKDYFVCELCFYDMMHRVPIVKIWCSLGNWSFSILQSLNVFYSRFLLDAFTYMYMYVMRYRGRVPCMPKHVRAHCIKC